MNTPDQDLDNWIQLRKEQALNQEASPHFEREILAQIRDLAPKEKQSQQEQPFVFPKPLSASICTTIGLAKFFLILQLLY